VRVARCAKGARWEGLSYAFVCLNAERQCRLPGVGWRCGSLGGVRSGFARGLQGLDGRCGRAKLLMRGREKKCLLSCLRVVKLSGDKWGC
jgi:hypothetical protein